MKNNNILKNKIIFCMLLALEFVFCFTILGSVPIGPVVATTAMVPVIIASLGLGLHYGFLLGLIWGFISLFIWTFMPPNPATAFLFSPFYQTAQFKGNIGSLLASILPRVLSGVAPIICYNGFKKILNDKISLVVSSAIGSMANTLLMMLIWFIFFSNQIESIVDKGILLFIGSTVLMNGIPEMILCMVICPIVVVVLRDKFLA